MDTACFFIKDKAIYGSYPSSKDIDELQMLGVRNFIDLTTPTDKNIKKYKTDYNYINYPIEDNKEPENLEDFVIFINKLREMIFTSPVNDIFYIHCRGGHGRSGLVSACIISSIYYFKPSETLQYISYCHNKRPFMTEKSRETGSPSRVNQKTFILNNCGEFFITRNSKLYPFTKDVAQYIDSDTKYKVMFEVLEKWIIKNNLKKHLMETYMTKLTIKTYNPILSSKLSCIMMDLRNKYYIEMF